MPRDSFTSHLVFNFSKLVNVSEPRASVMVIPLIKLFRFLFSLILLAGLEKPLKHEVNMLWTFFWYLFDLFLNVDSFFLWSHGRFIIFRRSKHLRLIFLLACPRCGCLSKLFGLNFLKEHFGFASDRLIALTVYDFFDGMVLYDLFLQSLFEQLVFVN